MQNKAGGFTLIEILVVILIVGITMGFALLAFGDFGHERKIIMAAEQFSNYVKFVQQHAILETSTFGISINQHGYQVLQFNSEKNWQPVANKRVFNEQFFPKNTTVQLIKKGVNKNLTPQIIFNASGDMTPFILNFNSDNNIEVAQVEGRNDGTVVAKKRLQTS